MSQVSPSLWNTARDLDAAIRAGLLPLPGTAKEPLLKRLADADDLPAWVEANRTTSTSLFGRLKPIPGTVRGPLQIAAAGGGSNDLLAALGRGFGIQQSHRRSRAIVLVSTSSICILAAIGVLALATFNAPLIEQQQLLQTGDNQPPLSFLRAAFGPLPMLVSLTAFVLLAAIGLTATMIASHRRIDWSLSRWIASEAHNAMEQTLLTVTERRAIVHELLVDWCWLPSESALACAGLLGVALADESPQKAASLARAVRFHRRQGDLLEAEQSRLIPTLGSLTAGLAVLLYGIALMRPLAALFETLATTPVVTLWEATR